ncbi:MAG TPA: PepSY-associated TM helix domain-containing protein, partial [Bryobacteraceae bacterium]|nr:PepSY-associated TM helix domain-containing protein [Bryobacteraceae bacterium]
MGFVQQYVRQPQKLWLRKALFQIHLWLGIGIGLYIIAIGLTGSILVFKEEAVASLVPKLPPSADVSGPQANVSTVISKMRGAYPKDRLFLVSFPSAHTREFQVIAMRPGKDGG